MPKGMTAKLRKDEAASRPAYKGAEGPANFLKASTKRVVAKGDNNFLKPKKKGY